jgi:hypothetical protein
MIHLPVSVRVYLCTSACEMRKIFDRLQALVSETMQLDAFAGHLFVFASRRQHQTTFHIPIEFCGYRISLAPTARQHCAVDPTYRSSRQRGRAC